VWRFGPAHPAVAVGRRSENPAPLCFPSARSRNQKNTKLWRFDLFWLRFLLAVRARQPAGCQKKTPEAGDRQSINSSTILRWGSGVACRAIWPGDRCKSRCWWGQAEERRRVISREAVCSARDRQRRGGGKLTQSRLLWFLGVPAAEDRGANRMTIPEAGVV